TVIYVTHDQGEAFAIADRIVLMRQGRVVQSGRPEAVYRQPADAWVARFLGMQNLIPARWLVPGQVESEAGVFDVEGSGEGEVTLLIRPEAAVLDPDGPGTTIRGIVSARVFLGALVRVTVRCAGGQVLGFELPSGDGVPPAGQEIALRIRPGGAVCLR
ncbi:MAG: TOBE domain-containing protein, partial [Anaerolineae bacterium]|nr:TOBE domain-containing protein [Anaerolineae bacterium]